MDLLNEIFSTIRKNKLRTLLTGFSIAWGIFILIVLLSIGNGFRNGVESNFSGNQTAVVTIYPNMTSKPYGGYQSNRAIELTPKDAEMLKRKFADHITNVSLHYDVGYLNVDYIDKSSTAMIRGADRLSLDIDGQKIENGQGRLLNHNDNANCEKVVNICSRTKKYLFEDSTAVGKYITINGIQFKVIGVFKSHQFSNNSRIYMPSNTAQKVFNIQNVSSLSFATQGLLTKSENQDFNDKLRKTIASVHHFDPTDDMAIWIDNSFENKLQSTQIFNGINIFLWIMGVATLIAGIIGIGNIMYITVNERRNEIGIKKALGAKPRSIVAAIVLEATLITTFFGYCGMVAGVLIMALVDKVMSANMDSNGITMFKNPTIGMDIVFGATLLLIVSSSIAGYIPARKAARIKPVEAIRN